MSHIQTLSPTPDIPLSTRLLRHYATAFATALFAVIAVSGVMMFFHLQDGFVKSAHEWLGLVFVVAAAFHVVRNWGPFVTLMKKTRTLAIVAVTLAIAGIFIASAGNAGGGGNPMIRIAHAVERAPLSAVAPVLGQPADQMIARLQSAGFDVSGPDDSLAAIETAAGVKLPELLRVILPDASR